MENNGAPLEQQEVCLEVKDLWKVFGEKPENLLEMDNTGLSKMEIQEQTGNVLALKDVSFQVHWGEFFVIMGLSGSGKSTLIRCLLRLHEPTRGQILIKDEDICVYDKTQLMNLRRNTTAMVFQHFGLFPHYTVLDNAAYGLKVRGTPKKERIERAMEAIETVGLKGWESYLPNALSGGMQQRVGLARALANDPEILLMDEPFSGLDPLIRRQMQDELIEIQDRVKLTIIFVTHDLHEALKLGSNIAIMRDGEIIQLGTPEDIITSPADGYVRDFVQDASPAKVLTARSIMEDPRQLVYEWQGPKTALHLLRSNHLDYAFVVGRHNNLFGLVTRDQLKKNLTEKSLKQIIHTDLPSCGPDTLVEDLLPIATSSPYPIPVLDENGKFLGEIHNDMILDSMVPSQEPEQEKEEEADA